jgi:xanthine dehydrogenase accessory factor
MVPIYKTLAELEEKGEAGAVCMIIRTNGSTPRHQGSKMLVFPDGSFIGTVGGGEVENRVRLAALESLKTGMITVLEYKMVDPQAGDPGVCGGQLEVIVEPILPTPRLVVIGGGHVGKSVAALGKFLGFKVIVSDDRAEFCTPESNPDADEFYPVPMKDLPASMHISPYTYLVLTTRGTDVDVEGLPALLDSNAGYIGVIGSRRRWLMTVKGLEKQGIPQEKIDQIHSPVGLEIHAETPEEIAVSIMAEILMVRNGGTGKPMKS